MNSVSDMQNALKRVTAVQRAEARFAYERAVSTARIQAMQNNASHPKLPFDGYNLIEE